MTMAEFVARARWQLVRLVVPRTSQVRTVGSGVRIAQSSHISGGKYVRIDANVTIGGQCAILVPDFETRPANDEPVIVIGSGTTIGDFCTISAVSRIHIHENVLFGPRVWVTDHNHVYTDIAKPIMAQGWTVGGAVEIEDGCWIGTGAVIIGNRGLRIGRGSVVGANAVVTSDVPPHCVVGGNPARILRQYDPGSDAWRGVGE